MRNQEEVREAAERERALRFRRMERGRGDEVDWEVDWEVDDWEVDDWSGDDWEEDEDWRAARARSFWRARMLSSRSWSWERRWAMRGSWPLRRASMSPTEVGVSSGEGAANWSMSSILRE